MVIIEGPLLLLVVMTRRQTQWMTSSYCVNIDYWWTDSYYWTDPDDPVKAQAGLMTGQPGWTTSPARRANDEGRRTVGGPAQKTQLVVTKVIDGPSIEPMSPVIGDGWPNPDNGRCEDEMTQLTRTSIDSEASWWPGPGRADGLIIEPNYWTVIIDGPSPDGVTQADPVFDPAQLDRPSQLLVNDSDPDRPSWWGPNPASQPRQWRQWPRPMADRQLVDLTMDQPMAN